MQSSPTANSQSENAPASHSARNTRLIRYVFSFAVVSAIGIGCYFVAFVYPRPIARYDELQAHVGKRVTFTTIVDRRAKAYELVYLDGKEIRFSHVVGGIDWSPEPSEVCRVVGNVEHEPYNQWGIPYRLSRAEYFPLPANPQHDSGN